MISKDIEDDFDAKLNFAEYIASFINPDAVAKIKSARESRKDNRFMDNAEFEDMIKNKDFLKVEYNKDGNNALPNIPEERRGARDIRLPKEISGILKLNRDNF